MAAIDKEAFHEISENAERVGINGDIPLNEYEDSGEDTKEVVPLYTNATEGGPSRISNHLISEDTEK